MTRACTLLLISGSVLFGQRTTGNAPSAIAPFRAPQSIGLSGPSIGLSGPSIGVSGATTALPAPPHTFPAGRYPLYPPLAGGTPGQHGHGQKSGRPGQRVGRGVYGLPLPFYGLPYLAPPDNGTYEESAAASELPAQAEDTGLGDQVRQLSQQLADLQNQLGRKAEPDSLGSPETPPAEDAPPAPPVTVVLRDGKTLQVQSYAVMGGVFWDLSSQPGRQIPIANIDVPASAKASEASGAEFPAIRSGS